MNTQNRSAIKQNAFLFWFILLLTASLACSLGSKSSAIPPNATDASFTASDDTSSATSIATANRLASLVEALSKTFPLPAGTEIDPESVSESNPDRGSFTLRSTAGLTALVDFYTTTLPAKGWTFRYTDANTIGGVTQFWKKETVYLSMEFGYDRTGLMGKIKYQSVAADALEKLPTDFRIPDKAELTNASNTSWDFTIDQDFAAVIAFYAKASAGWGPCSGPGGQGEGDDGGGSTFPPGASPMPSPTRDSRPMKSYCWILPSQNQVELAIWPHGDATLLHVYLTSLNPSDSGLPADIPIYPGATIQSSEPGSVTFMAGASFEAVKAFYEEKLTTAGWTVDGQPIEAEGAIIMNWKKGNQTIMISITAIGANDCLVMIAYEGS
jgi:hypothetical protein